VEDLVKIVGRKSQDGDDREDDAIKDILEVDEESDDEVISLYEEITRKKKRKIGFV